MEMETEKKPTKDRILESALTLFAEKGYDGVGVDLIAENAGIKGPSLYKHFKGKEDILDALIDRAARYYQTNFGSAQNPGKTPESMDELIAISMAKIRFTLHDEMIKRVRRMLTMEQFRSRKISLLTTKYNIDIVQSIYKQIFTKMIENGIMRAGNPEMLAIQFASPVSLFIQQIEREPEHEQELLQRIEAYFQFFAEEHKA